MEHFSIIHFIQNSKINIADVKNILKTNSVKTILVNKRTLIVLVENMDQLKDILFNNISSNEIIEIISMEMGKKIKLQLEEKNKYVNTNGLNGSGDSNCGGGDNQSDPYVRKSDLADFVRKSDLANFVTKADLKEELKDFVRKEDLKEFVTRSELKEELNVLKTDLKEELKDFVKRSELKYELNQLETNLRKDMATKDEMNAGFNEIKQLILAINANLIGINDRLTRLENKPN
jgi:hypothetical protein